MNKPTIFLITDSQFKEDAFLEDIDSLLNASEVPNLFAADEKVELIEVCFILSIYFIYLFVYLFMNSTL